VGDVEANLPKNKRQQQQFAQAVQVGMWLTCWKCCKRC
jgi:hypothetical protein